LLCITSFLPWLIIIIIWLPWLLHFGYSSCARRNLIRSSFQNLIGLLARVIVMLIALMLENLIFYLLRLLFWLRFVIFENLLIRSSILVVD